MLALQFRLLDRFGDNGVIAIVIGRIKEGGTCFLDTWLMSCRVLGRGVERATLNVIAETAGRMGARLLIGEFIPSDRNGIVCDHYVKLGFQAIPDSSERAMRSGLNLDGFTPLKSDIAVRQG